MTCKRVLDGPRARRSLPSTSSAPDGGFTTLALHSLTHHTRTNNSPPSPFRLSLSLLRPSRRPPSTTSRRATSRIRAAAAALILQHPPAHEPSLASTPPPTWTASRRRRRTSPRSPSLIAALTRWVSTLLAECQSFSHLSELESSSVGVQRCHLESRQNSERYRPLLPTFRQ